MFDQYINWKVFLISLIVGLFLVYNTAPNTKTVFVYPTKDNTKMVQYKDIIGNCYALDIIEQECPSDKSQISNVPVQIPQ